MSFQWKKARDVQYQAMAHRSLNAVKLLLRQKSPDLERYDRNGDIPLHIAVQMNSLELVDLLLTYPRIKPNSTNCEGNTPL